VSVSIQRKPSAFRSTVTAINIINEQSALTIVSHVDAKWPSRVKDLFRGSNVRDRYNRSLLSTLSSDEARSGALLLPSSPIERFLRLDGRVAPRESAAVNLNNFGIFLTFRNICDNNNNNNNLIIGIK